MLSLWYRGLKFSLSVDLLLGNVVKPAPWDFCVANMYTCDPLERESVLETAGCDSGNVIGGMLSNWRFGSESFVWETALSGDRPLGAGTGGRKVTLLTEEVSGNNCENVVSGVGTLCVTSEDMLMSEDVG